VSTSNLTSSEEENDALPENTIKMNKKSHCDWREGNLEATMKTRHGCEFLAEPGMGRKGQLSPISLAKALMLLLSPAAT